MNILQRCYQGYKDWTTTSSGMPPHSGDGRMIILHDPDSLLHETVELLGAKLKPALESPERVKAIVSAIQKSGSHELRYLTASPEDHRTAIELAKATHDHQYLDHIQHVFQQWLDAELVKADESVLPECFRLHNNAVGTLKPPKDIYARHGYYAFDMSTGITRDSWRSIIASANLAVQAAQLLVADTISANSRSEHNKSKLSPPKSVIALCRPPGHHCTGQQAGGYCYINNIALSISKLRQESATRIPSQQPTLPPNSSSTTNTTTTTTTTSQLKFAILDLDFHHGNGTQEIFYNDPSVLYTSLHGQDEFPYYTGHPSERGPENTPAYGTNMNFPLPVGTSAAGYLSTLDTALDHITKFKPDYLLLSLGFDTFHLDPLGSFDIRTENYAEIAHLVRRRTRDIQALIVFEGGYVVDRLGENLLSFLNGWMAGENGGEGEGKLEDGSAVKGE